jgi:hypothetical protein
MESEMFVNPEARRVRVAVLHEIVYPEPRGPWVLPVGQLVLWYGIFARWGRLLATMGLPVGLHLTWLGLYYI